MKEEYHKPEIRSETIEIGAYGGGGYGQGPIQYLQPLFGACCP